MYVIISIFNVGRVFSTQCFSLQEEQTTVVKSSLWQIASIDTISSRIPLKMCMRSLFCFSRPRGRGRGKDPLLLPFLAPCCIFSPPLSLLLSEFFTSFSCFSCFCLKHGRNRRRQQKEGGGEARFRGVASQKGEEEGGRERLTDAISSSPPPFTELRRFMTLCVHSLCFPFAGFFLFFSFVLFCFQTAKLARQ